MARFYGEVGFGEGMEKAEGVWDDVITERKYFGDVVRNSARFQNGSQINDDLSTGNSISIVADSFAGEHFFAIRYVRWAGVLWKVAEVTDEHPRLLLRLGGVYNGPTA